MSHCQQLENRLGGEEKFQERVTKHLIPCLAQFSVAMADDSLWKPLNYQILLKTRDSSPKVRRSGAAWTLCAWHRGHGRRTCTAAFSAGGWPVSGRRLTLRNLNSTYRPFINSSPSHAHGVLDRTTKMLYTFKYCKDFSSSCFLSTIYTSVYSQTHAVFVHRPFL